MLLPLLTAAALTIPLAAGTAEASSTVAPTAETPCAPCRTERVLWRPDRRLRVRDFQGPLGARAHAAEANTGIATRSYAGANPRTFRLEATTFFDPCKSWFREQPRAAERAATLAHEQLHFDISELYARRLVRRYATEIRDHADFLRRHQRIYDEVWAESRAMQDAYDAAVYADEARQAEWDARVAAGLRELADYAAKEAELPMRAGDARFRRG